jgi:hypothetical protein
MAKFKFIKDFDAEFFNLSNGEKGVKSFKIGDVIEGGNDPSMQGMETLVAIDTFQTTLEGKMPNWNMVGQEWVSIPFNVVQEVSADTPTTNDKKPLTNTQKWMILIGVTGVLYFIMYQVNKKN